MKKFQTWLKDHKSFITRALILAFLLGALPLTLYLNSKSQDTRQHADTTQPTGVLACTFDTWNAVPDWSKGNNSLGNGYYCGPENPENRTICAAAKPGIYDDGGNGSGVWVPGPAMPAGTVAGVVGHAPNFSVPFGGKLPVSYDSSNDIVRFEFTGKLQESAWSRVVRRMDDSYFINYTADMSSHTIATGVLFKYEIMRIGREAFYAVVHDNGREGDPDATAQQKELTAFMKQELGQPGGQTFTAHAHYRTSNANGFVDTFGQPVTRALLSKLMGFDITHLDIASWGSLNSSSQWDASNETVRHQQMIDETKACGTAVPTPVPTSTTPVSCSTHLTVPAADFAVNLPSFTPNICSAATAYDPTTGHAKAQELIDCGDYWVTNWCNATSDTQRQNVVYACRGWSQTGDGLPNGVDSFYRYFPKRIFTVTTSEGTSGPGGALLSNITKYGDFEGRRKSWNDLMAEVKSGAIAFPYGYKDVAGALQAASSAIFNKPWGAIVEQERLNNCSINGSTPVNSPTPGPSTGANETSVKATMVLDGIGSGGDYTNPDASDKSNKTPKTTSRPVALQFLDKDTKALKYTKLGTLTYDTASGTFSGVISLGTDIVNGLYYLNAKIDGYLIKNIPAFTISQGQTTNLPSVHMTVGDINGDNKLSVLDYNILSDCYSDINTTPHSCTDANKKLSDLNDDGSVNQFDYNLFVRELPKQQGD